MSTPTPTDPIRATTDAVLRAAVAFDKIDSDPGHGKHAKATAYAEYLAALMNYHMAELALIRRDDATGPQRPMLLEAAEAPQRGRTLSYAESGLIMAALDHWASSTEDPAETTRCETLRELVAGHDLQVR